MLTTATVEATGCGAGSTGQANPWHSYKPGRRMCHAMPQGSRSKQPEPDAGQMPRIEAIRGLGEPSPGQSRRIRKTLIASSTSWYVSSVRTKAALGNAFAMPNDDRAAREDSSARSRTLAISAEVHRRGERERQRSRPRVGISISSALPLGPGFVASVGDGGRGPSNVTDAGSSADSAIPAAGPPVHQEMLHLLRYLRDGRNSLMAGAATEGRRAGVIAE